MDALDPATVGWGVLVLVLGLSLRLITSYLAVMGGGLTTSEQLFVALAWLPKATVQAAIGPLALDKAKEDECTEANVVPCCRDFPRERQTRLLAS